MGTVTVSERLDRIEYAIAELIALLEAELEGAANPPDLHTPEGA